jgi:hypothetical protein
MRKLSKNWVKLHQRYNVEELLKMIKTIEDNPDHQRKNPQPFQSVLTDKAAQKVFDLSYAVQEHLKDQRIAAGGQNLDLGYSGRKNNRRH